MQPQILCTHQFHDDALIVILDSTDLTLQKYIMLQKTPKIWDNLRGNVMNGISQILLNLSTNIVIIAELSLILHQLLEKFMTKTSILQRVSSIAKKV